jgi:hypothetical protein
VLTQATPALVEYGRARVERLSAGTLEALIEALEAIREGA